MQLAPLLGWDKVLGSTEQRLLHNNIDHMQRDGRTLHLWGVRVRGVKV